jgi:hypothetical protein
MAPTVEKPDLAHVFIPSIASEFGVEHHAILGGAGAGADLSLFRMSSLTGELNG